MSNRGYKSYMDQMFEDNRKEKKDHPPKGWVNPYQWKPKKAKKKKKSTVASKLKIRKKKDT
jgi:hypothetical protein